MAQHVICLIGLAAVRVASRDPKFPTSFSITPAFTSTASNFLLIKLNSSRSSSFSHKIYDLARYLLPSSTTPGRFIHNSISVFGVNFPTALPDPALHQLLCERYIAQKSCGNRLETGPQIVWFPDAVQWQQRGAPGVVKVEYRPALRTWESNAVKFGHSPPRPLLRARRARRFCFQAMEFSRSTAPSR